MGRFVSTGKQHHWTEAERLELVRLRVDGKTYEECADALGISAGSAQVMSGKLHVSYTRLGHKHLIKPVQKYGRIAANPKLKDLGDSFEWVPTPAYDDIVVSAAPSIPHKSRNGVRNQYGM